MVRLKMEDLSLLSNCLSKITTKKNGCGEAARNALILVLKAAKRFY
jgi:hypothetical protein